MFQPGVTADYATETVQIMEGLMFGQQKSPSTS